ncbi:hypothetical protein [Rhodococcus aetherivorans]|uniref:hypothetical protein n=1 Tax=Rhodococcus TaxID=1827 RepID=UPI0024201B62|nr:hypothetical protein [Rhodococcus aetherivorans]WFS15179.1 hypothetical protein P9K37_09105 [Rhodococcus aetherivorans]
MTAQTEALEPGTPRAPRGLGRRGKALWRDLHQTFDFTQDPHRQALIEDACRTADVIDRLQEAVDAHDLRVRGSQGQPVAAPELAELRQYRALLGQLLSRLALPDTEELAEVKAKHVSDVRRKAAFKSVEARRAG